MKVFWFLVVFIVGCGVGVIGCFLMFYRMMHESIDVGSPYDPKMPKGNILHPERDGIRKDTI